MTDTDRLEMVPPPARPAHPHTGASPEYVVRTFLEGLREPDVPAAWNGYRTAYNLVTPDYRSDVGDLDAFVSHLRTPFMSMLVEPSSVRRGVLDVNDEVTRAVQRVEVTDEEGQAYRYEFTLEKQTSGRFADCWLVDELTLVMDDDRPAFEHVPTVEYAGQEIKCEPEENLRSVIRRVEGLSPHNGSADSLNCGGNSLCGTCAVEVVDAAGEDESEPSGGERRRLGLPPFRGSDVPNLRLACRTTVTDDVRVRKHDGRMGQKRVEDDGPWIEQFLDGEAVRVRDQERERPPNECDEL